MIDILDPHAMSFDPSGSSSTRRCTDVYAVSTDSSRNGSSSKTIVLGDSRHIPSSRVTSPSMVLGTPLGHSAMLRYSTARDRFSASVPSFHRTYDVPPISSAKCFSSVVFSTRLRPYSAIALIPGFEWSFLRCSRSLFLPDESCHTERYAQCCFEVFIKILNFRILLYKLIFLEF